MGYVGRAPDRCDQSLEDYAAVLAGGLPDQDLAEEGLAEAAQAAAGSRGLLEQRLCRTALRIPLFANLEPASE